MSDITHNKDRNTYDDKDNDSGMLSSSHIAYYVDKYAIIDNFDESCLGPASYHMRIGGDVLTWDKGERVDFSLGEKEDRNRNTFKSVKLKPNSLTFVTTIEKFNLTKDIICRFNLKSKWVHQGLLLGTGPIVDPQLNAHLLIPIHNFSSQPVRMDYGDEIISVEFTKTLNPDDTFDLSTGNKAEYVENDSWDFNFKEYRKRIGDKPVASSVLSQFDTYDEAIQAYKASIEELTQKNKKTNEKLKEEIQKSLSRFTTISFISYIAAVIACIVLVITTWQLIDKTHEKADSAYNLIKQYDKNGVDFRSFALKASVDELQEEFSLLKQLSDESSINSERIAIKLNQISEQFSKEIELLKMQLEEFKKNRNKETGWGTSKKK